MWHALFGAQNRINIGLLTMNMWFALLGSKYSPVQQTKWPISSEIHRGVQLSHCRTSVRQSPQNVRQAKSIKHCQKLINICLSTFGTVKVGKSSVRVANRCRHLVINLIYVCAACSSINIRKTLQLHLGDATIWRSWRRYGHQTHISESFRVELMMNIYIIIS